MGFFQDEEEEKKQIDPLVIQSLAQKYPEANLSAYDKFKSDFGDDARKKAEAESSEAQSGLGWAQFAAGIGDAMAGRDSSQTAKNFGDIRKGIDEKTVGAFDKRKAGALQDYSTKRSMDQGQRDDETRSREDDINSDESKTVQGLLVKMGMPREQALKISATRGKELSPVVMKMYEIEQRKLERFDKKQEAQAKKNEGYTDGIKALDKDYAKDYNDWTSTGRSTVDKNLQRLRDAKAALEKDKSLTGPIVGLTPDFVRNLTNENAIRTRDDVRAAAQGALKATLGAQFTEKEGERIMAAAYNEKLSPEANIAKIQAAIDELETNRNNNEKKLQYFQQNKGTLAGMNAASPQAQAPLMVKILTPNGKTKLVPKEQLQDALSAGAKLFDQTAGR